MFKFRQILPKLVQVLLREERRKLARDIPFFPPVIENQRENQRQFFRAVPPLRLPNPHFVAQQLKRDPFIGATLMFEENVNRSPERFLMSSRQVDHLKGHSPVLRRRATAYLR